MNGMVATYRPEGLARVDRCDRPWVFGETMRLVVGLKFD